MFCTNVGREVCKIFCYRRLNNGCQIWKDRCNNSDDAVVHLRCVNHVLHSCVSLASTLAQCSCCFFSSSFSLSLMALNRSFSFRFLADTWKIDIKIITNSLSFLNLVFCFYLHVLFYQCPGIHSFHMVYQWFNIFSINNTHLDNVAMKKRESTRNYH